MSRREVRIAPGGARGPRPTGCGGRMGRTESFAPTRFVRDVVPQGHLFRCAPLQDAVPYAPCHCEPVRAAKQVPLGYRLARQSVSPQRKGRIPTPVTVSLARNDSAAALQGSLCEGAVGAADGGREKTRDVSPSASASRCHLPRRGRLWSSAPLTNSAGWV